MTYRYDQKFAELRMCMSDAKRVEVAIEDSGDLCLYDTVTGAEVIIDNGADASFVAEALLQYAEHTSTPVSETAVGLTAPGLRDPLSIDDALRILNEAVDLDADAVQALIEYRVECNDKLADHPSIQVGGVEINRVGILGLINGLFGVGPDGWGAIAAVVDDDGWIVTGFIRCIPSQVTDIAEAADEIRANTTPESVEAAAGGVHVPNDMQDRVADAVDAVSAEAEEEPRRDVGGLSAKLTSLLG